ncbi:MAG: 16S rRNA processing protein RimM [Desulfuromonas sp.]|nr:MAG: 16S rRNA processing protein RimM [Desulfuromonas sp.]
MNKDPETLFDVGRVVATHGLRGDLKVRLNSGDPGLLLNVDQVSLRLPGGEQLDDLVIVRQLQHKEQVLLRFRDYESINLVERLIGSQVLLPEEDLPELEADEYYWRQLEGLQVIDAERGDIGRLRDIYTTAAHDTYVVTGMFGEVEIPAVKEFIREIDLDERVMKVALPQGLIPEDE